MPKFKTFDKVIYTEYDGREIKGFVSEVGVERSDMEGNEKDYIEVILNDQYTVHINNFDCIKKIEVVNE